MAAVSGFGCESVQVVWCADNSCITRKLTSEEFEEVSECLVPDEGRVEGLGR